MRAAGIDEGEVGVGVVEVLGDGGVGPGLDLAPKVLQVFGGARGLGVELGVGRDLDVEPVAVLGADEGNQLVGVAEVPARPGAHAGGQIAAQGHDAADAMAAVVIEDLADLGAGGADAGEVWGGFDPLPAQPVHGLEGPLAGLEPPAP